MKSNIKHILTIIAVFITAVLVSVPCSVKRDIQKALSVPVSPFSSPAKPNKSVVCITSIKENIPANTVFQKQALQKQPYQPASPELFHGKLQNGLSIPRAIIPSLSVPIYISHRQFLI